MQAGYLTSKRVEELEKQITEDPLYKLIENSIFKWNEHWSEARTKLLSMEFFNVESKI